MLGGPPARSLSPAAKIARLDAALHEFDDLGFGHAGLHLYGIKTGEVTQSHGDDFGIRDCAGVCAGRGRDEIGGKAALGHVEITGGARVWLPNRLRCLRLPPPLAPPPRGEELRVGGVSGDIVMGHRESIPLDISP